jgi:hypothetical protein
MGCGTTHKQSGYTKQRLELQKKHGTEMRMHHHEEMAEGSGRPQISIKINKLVLP